MEHLRRVFKLKSIWVRLNVCCCRQRGLCLLLLFLLLPDDIDETGIVNFVFLAHLLQGILRHDHRGEIGEASDQKVSGSEAVVLRVCILCEKPDSKLLTENVGTQYRLLGELILSISNL